VVRDLKGYRGKTDERFTSPGWFILLFSHMAILVLGISLGYWIGGSFSQDPMTQESAVREAASEQDRVLEPSESEADKAENQVQSAEREKGGDGEPLEPAGENDGALDYRFHKILPDETIPDTERVPKPKVPKRESPLKEPAREKPEMEETAGSPPQSTPSIVYLVQVASFRVEELAETLRDSLRKRGYAAEVAMAVVKEKGKWYRVRIGPFMDKMEAEKTVLEIEQIGNFEPIITREKTGGSPS
jgi:cell division septation protein DedD